MEGPKIIFDPGEKINKFKIQRNTVAEIIDEINTISRADERTTVYTVHSHNNFTELCKDTAASE